MVLGCINTADTRALRRLHPAIADAVAAVPWADMGTRVHDIVRWRAALPAAVGAAVSKLPDKWGPAAVSTLMGLTSLAVPRQFDCCGIAAGMISRLPPTLTSFIAPSTYLPPTVAFTHLHALHTLDCSGTSAVRDGVGGLPPSLRILCIDKCTLSLRADFSHLRVLQRLSCRSGTLSDDAMASLPPSLEELDARQDSSGHYYGSSLAHLTRLRVLRFAHTDLGSTARGSLPMTLTELELSHSNAGVYLNHHRSLRTLKMADSCSLFDFALAYLPPSLVSLDVSGCHDLTRAAVLPNLPALQVLDVSHTCLGNAALASMPPGLVTLHMERCGNVTPAARMDHLVALRQLYAVGTGVPQTALAACRARGGFAPWSSARTTHDGTVTALAALPDGQLVCGCKDGSIHLWDPERGRGATVVQQVQGVVKALAVLRDGCRVAIGVSSMENGGIIVWDSRTAMEPGVTIYRGSVGGVVALHDGTLAVLCSGDKAVRVLHAGTGGIVATLAKGNARLLAGMHGGKLAIGLCGGSVQLWDMERRAAITSLATQPHVVAQLADDWVATSGGPNMVDVFDATTGECVYRRKEANDGYRRDLAALAALPDGRLAGGTYDGTILLWDTRPGGTRSSSLPAQELCTGRWEHQNDEVAALLPLPDGRLVSSSNTDGMYRVYCTLQVWHVGDAPAH